MKFLIVVLIIGIIASIAISNLLASHRSAKQGSAISMLRPLQGAEVTYQLTSGADRFGTHYAMSQASLIDSTLATAVTPANAKNIYYLTDNVFILSGKGLPSRYSIDCQPVRHILVSTFAAKGSCRFFITEVGVI